MIDQRDGIRVACLAAGIMLAVAGVTPPTACRADALSTASSTDRIVDIQVTTSRPAVQIAEPFEVTIVVTADARQIVAFPPINDRWGDFEVIEVGPLQRRVGSDPGSVRWSKTIQMESLEVGTLTIPALEIAISSIDESEQAVVQHSRSLDVVVKGVISAEEQNLSDKFRDIAEAPPAPATPNSRWSSAAAWLGLPIALIAIWVARRWWKAKQTINPFDQARTDLERLRAANHSGEIPPMKLAVLLRDVLRQFQARRGNRVALAMTTSQLVEQMEADEPASVRPLGDLLRAVEADRFAARTMRDDARSVSRDQFDDAVTCSLAWVRQQRHLAMQSEAD